MSYRTEFPSFPEMPEAAALLAQGWTDTSWHNDACPSFKSFDGMLLIWIEHPDESKRDGGDRFVVEHMPEPVERDDPRYGEQAECLYAGDDWDAACGEAYINPELPVYPDTLLLAVKFSELLREDLGAETMEEVIRKNRTPEYANACASHDYCDANMVMHAAWEDLTGEAPDVGDERGARIWNRAWDAAKASDFNNNV